jgi:hypothetical protein
MHTAKIRWCAIGALVAGAIWLLVAQRTTGEALRSEIVRLSEEQRERTRLLAENRRLRAAQVTAAEMETLRADRGEVARLRGEIEKLRRSADAKESAVAKAAPKEYVPSIFDGPMPPSMWKNAGAATPGAALETVLWAAAGGDTEALAARLVFFDVRVRAKAEVLLAGLPEATRAQYGSPEQLLAALTAKDVPLRNATIYDTKTEYDGERIVIAQLSDGEKRSTGVRFMLRKEGEEWRLVVPQSAVENYAAALKSGVK